ncbi:MAG: ATP-dependent Clp protease adaptor ClpS [Deltaproteobacteria bacterium]|nr:ATP-dependent Clp protease adaptor ClpS [Deltaproteobacteria bacterium]
MPTKKQLQEEGDTLTREETKIRKPKRYWVIMHNDDYTSQEFVTHVLEIYFHKPSPEAHRLMMEVHTKGKAGAGLYSKDMAETKASQVMQYARENGMPLKLSTQAES